MGEFILTIAAGGLFLFFTLAAVLVAWERTSQTPPRRDYLAMVALAFCLVANPAGFIGSALVGLPVVWVMRAVVS